MGGSISPAPIQGDCSYTIYGRIHSEFVIQYSLDRIPGISYIEFRLADTHAEDSEENLALRASLMVDLAR